MKKHDIELFQRYAVKESGKLVAVEIVGLSPYGGWIGRNVDTGRSVRIKTAARLRRPVPVAAANVL